MAEITAVMVKNLRERSGLPMMDCKKALTATGGDEEAAMELLRKSGAAAAEKKAGRATSEGRIGAHVDTAKKAGALVELNCETAPVANNPEFKALADKIARHVALTGHTEPATLLKEPFVDDPKMTVTDVINDVLNRLRENMQVTRAVHQSGHVAAYVHHTGRIGVLVVAEGATDKTDLLNDVCMHIAAMNPDALSRNDMPAALVAREEEIYREQIKASGKPENLIDKILVGKMNKFYAERVLLEQPFVKDDKKKVGDVLKAAGVTVRSYTRLVVGE